MQAAGSKRRVRASKRAQSAGLDIAGERAGTPTRVASAGSARKNTKAMPRNVARSVMTLFCKLHSEIEFDKSHGDGGHPRKGRLHETAAEYLLALPDSRLWDLNGDQGKKKLANYLRNADSKGRSYAAQHRDSANKEMVAVDKSYDFWDIAEVRNYYLTSQEHKESARQASQVPEIEGVDSDDLREIVPLLSVADTTTLGSSAAEHVAAAETMMKRSSSLGGAVNTFKETLSPLVTALQTRLTSSSSVELQKLQMRESAFVWLHEHYFGIHRIKALVHVSKASHAGRSLAFAVSTLLKNDAEEYEVSVLVDHFVDHWNWKSELDEVESD